MFVRMLPTIGTIFVQPKAELVRDRLDVIACMPRRQSSKVETMLRAADAGGVLDVYKADKARD